MHCFRVSNLCQRGGRWGRRLELGSAQFITPSPDFNTCKKRLKSHYQPKALPCTKLCHLRYQTVITNGYSAVSELVSGFAEDFEGVFEMGQCSIFTITKDAYLCIAARV